MYQCKRSNDLHCRGTSGVDGKNDVKILVITMLHTMIEQCKYK